MAGYPVADDNSQIKIWWNGGTVAEHCCHCRSTQQTATHTPTHALLYHSAFVFLVGNNNCTIFTHIQLHFLHYCTIHAMSDANWTLQIQDTSNPLTFRHWFGESELSVHFGAPLQKCLKDSLGLSAPYAIPFCVTLLVPVF